MTSSLIHAELATVEQLFAYKHSGFSLPPFPGYTDDQWGIKAHNRPWVESFFAWTPGMKVMEVGGAYSTFPAYLARKHQVEAWVVDDFGKAAGETAMWSRWGNPAELPSLNPGVKYVFEQMGHNSRSLKDNFFDCIFSISTLEHLPVSVRGTVLKDIERCLKPGGIQIHTIDIPANIGAVRAGAGKFASAVLPDCFLPKALRCEINDWKTVFDNCGFSVCSPLPSIDQLLRRSVLVDSPDVVFRFYPPNNAPKPYDPAASLLVAIRRDS